jgi:DNA-binding transcriptional LysR family regulator
VELRHLQSFCAIAREMHVTRAAKQLRIAQPALTQQIRVLEKELGVSLLKRAGRGIALTEAGGYFYKEAELILRQLHNARLQIQEIARGKAGHLRVGVTEGASYYPTLATVFNQYQASSPGVKLIFSQRQTPELAAALREGQIDAAFMCPIPSPPSDLTVTNLYRERMLLAVPTGHAFRDKKNVPLSELKDQPIILVSHGATQYSLEGTLIAACGKYGFLPRFVQTMPEYMLALNLVASGIGLTFVPKYMDTIHSRAIHYLSVRTPLAIEMKIVFASRAREDSPVLGNLKRLALQAFGKAK